MEKIAYLIIGYKRRQIIYIKNIFCEKIDQLLDSYHFGASLDRLRVLEENAFKKEGELFTVPFNYNSLGQYDSISPSQVVAEIRSLFDVAWYGLNELHDRFKYHLSSPGELKDIAQNGYKKVVASHNVEKRLLETIMPAIVG